MHYQETSRAAWEAFVPVSAELDRQIMQAIEASMPRGLADFEIEARTERIHQAVSANRRHLVERGLLVDSGATTVKPNGRRAVLWIINPNLRQARPAPAPVRPSGRPEQRDLFADRPGEEGW